MLRLVVGSRTEKFASVAFSSGVRDGRSLLVLRLVVGSRTVEVC